MEILLEQLTNLSTTYAELYNGFLQSEQTDEMTLYWSTRITDIVIETNHLLKCINVFKRGGETLKDDELTLRFLIELDSRCGSNKVRPHLR
jgi:hypothetical protein